MDKNLLQASPYAEDDHLPIGRDPRALNAEERASLPYKSPIKAIRAKCLDCVGGNAAEVRKCVSTDCPLWGFRMGTNIHHARSASAAP